MTGEEPSRPSRIRSPSARNRQQHSYSRPLGGRWAQITPAKQTRAYNSPKKANTFRDWAARYAPDVIIIEMSASDPVPSCETVMMGRRTSSHMTVSYIRECGYHTIVKDGLPRRYLLSPSGCSSLFMPVICL